MTQKLIVNIDFASAKWKKAFPRMKTKIEAALNAAFDTAKKPAAFRRRTFEVNVVLTTDATIRKLNRDWRGKDKPTNVLAFPQFDYSAPLLPAFKGMPDTLGDIIIAIETMKRECKIQKKTLENHTLHLSVHGLLHLLGYDHINEKDAKTMEKYECDILRSLGYPHPYEVPAETGRTIPHGRRA